RDSSATLTVSPTLISSSPCSLRNCSIVTTPSDFRPALMTTTSERISTTTPLTMAPGFSLTRAIWLCSNSSAKDSVIVGSRLNIRVRVRRAHLLCACDARGKSRGGMPRGFGFFFGNRPFGTGGNRDGGLAAPQGSRQDSEHTVDHLGD